jgi:hypothetical protein
VTTVERIRQQFQDALGDLELRVLLEQLEQDLPSLSLKELGQFLKSPAARSVASVPASVLLNVVANAKAEAAPRRRSRGVADAG